MNTPTEQQLQQALAKMLPEKAIWSVEESGLFWKGRTLGNEVLDTELLHLCWLVEQEKLASFQLSQQYLIYVNSEITKQGPNQNLNLDFITDWSFHATWQQRTTALAKVLNIEIV